MDEIFFEIHEDEIDGGFVATAIGQGIHTEAETLNELRANIRDAVTCHFDNPAEMPKIVRLHFVRDEVLTV